MQTETVQTSLKALRSAFSVEGIILADEASVVFADSKIPQANLEQLLSVVDDIFFYFQNEGREVDQVAFGFNAIGLVVLDRKPHRLIVLHTHESDIDIIAKAGGAFLNDFLMGQFTGEFLKHKNQGQAFNAVNSQQAAGQTRPRPATERIMVKAESGFAAPQPLQQYPNQG